MKGMIGERIPRALSCLCLCFSPSYLDKMQVCHRVMHARVEFCLMGPRAAGDRGIRNDAAQDCITLHREEFHGMLSHSWQWYFHLFWECLRQDSLGGPKPASEDLDAETSPPPDTQYTWSFLPQREFIQGPSPQLLEENWAMKWSTKSTWAATSDWEHSTWRTASSHLSGGGKARIAPFTKRHIIPELDDRAQFLMCFCLLFSLIAGLTKDADSQVLQVAGSEALW